MRSKNAEQLISHFLFQERRERGGGRVPGRGADILPGERRARRRAARALRPAGRRAAARAPPPAPRPRRHHHINTEFFSFRKK